MESMPALRFLSYVERLAHYPGVLRNRAIAEKQRQEPPPAPSVQQPEPVAGQQVETLTADMMAIHPVWGALGNYSKAPLQTP